MMGWTGVYLAERTGTEPNMLGYIVVQHSPLCGIERKPELKLSFGLKNSLYFIKSLQPAKGSVA
jgi:hypothetical protein